MDCGTSSTCFRHHALVVCDRKRRTYSRLFISRHRGRGVVRFKASTTTDFHDEEQRVLSVLQPKLQTDGAEIGNGRVHQPSRPLKASQIHLWRYELVVGVGRSSVGICIPRFTGGSVSENIASSVRPLEHPNFEVPHNTMENREGLFTRLGRQPHKTLISSRV